MNNLTQNINSLKLSMQSLIKSLEEISKSYDELVLDRDKNAANAKLLKEQLDAANGYIALVDTLIGPETSRFLKDQAKRIRESVKAGTFNNKTKE